MIEVWCVGMAARIRVVGDGRVHGIIEFLRNGGCALSELR